MHGSKVVVVDRFFPSSKRCSDCGFHAGEMTLDARQWTCTNCGEAHDRDLNAAINLRNSAASSAVTVCGVGGSGARRSPRVKLPATKQKLGFAPIVSYFMSKRKYLRCQRDMALKCGILRAELFGMLAMYELDAEAGDETALAEMEARLTKIDKNDANEAIIEVMIPSKALQAGWVGQFDAAQRLLRPTAEHQATPVRRALCWAQVALYGAAAGDSDAADQAAKAAQNALNELEPHELRAMQYGFTLLFLALAAIVGNDVELARKWTDAADDSVIGHARRLCAMRATIRATRSIR